MKLDAQYRVAEGATVRCANAQCPLLGVAPPRVAAVALVLPRNALAILINAEGAVSVPLPRRLAVFRVPPLVRDLFMKQKGVTLPKI